nr:immunoglobulin heavy chain junction region [Macaca mulatta]MOW87242.1 immunoglobulin heavy chain junction region [Macaca mulatta]MOW88319.1 immunoglobulin heavy chain junction region [Macaca mulatta]MOW89066.1 immunoglobulin heavy chain junction region [Macaca mulatta]MOW91075.1 immunoglobulin heavy chain junction region [Macaca mulatta]
CARDPSPTYYYGSDYQGPGGLDSW